MAAKMPRVGRAWLRLTEAFETGRIHNNSIPPRRKLRKEHELHERLYGQLVDVIKDFGIAVHTNQQFDEVRDYFGQTWTPVGAWGGLREGIRLSYDSFYVLAHEFAHATDDLLGGCRGRAQRELVASAASYLFCVEYFGRGDMRHAVHYPTKYWGATEEDFRRLSDYIIDVFRQMDGLFKMYLTT